MNAETIDGIFQTETYFHSMHNFHYFSGLMLGGFCHWHMFSFSIVIEALSDKNKLVNASNENM